VPGQRNCQRQPDCGGHVACIDERAVLPVRLELGDWLATPPARQPLVLTGPPDPDRPQGQRSDPGPGGEAGTQVLGQALGQAVRSHGPPRMRVVDRKIVGQPLALGGPEDLGTGEVNDTVRASGLGR
jgi:hypothetical protein